MEELINNEKSECALRMLADRELPLNELENIIKKSEGGKLINEGINIGISKIMFMW